MGNGWIPCPIPISIYSSQYNDTRNVEAIFIRYMSGLRGAVRQFGHAKEALNDLKVKSDWLGEVQSAVEKMWMKLRKYYDKTAKPFAYVDATLLHPALKKKFMRMAGYEADLIEKYVRQTESRFKKEYDPMMTIERPRWALQRGKQRRPSTSDSDSWNGTQYSEFTSYMGLKRDPSVTDVLLWWKGYHAVYPKLSKMTWGVFAVPTGAGVER